MYLWRHSVFLKESLLLKTLHSCVIEHGRIKLMQTLEALHFTGRHSAERDMYIPREDKWWSCCPALNVTSCNNEWHDKTCPLPLVQGPTLRWRTRENQWSLRDREFIFSRSSLLIGYPTPVPNPKHTCTRATLKGFSKLPNIYIY